MRKFLLLAAVALMLAGVQTTAASAGTVQGMPPRAHVGHWGYSELSAAWWQWAASYPRSINPVPDQTGKNCGLGDRPLLFGQRVPVFFLAGNQGGKTVRTCSIPRGRKIFIPVINIEDSLTEPDSGGTLAGAIQVVTSTMDLVTQKQAWLDGHAVRVVRTQALCGFPINWVANNPFGVIPGPTTAVADGYYVWLPPLSTGSHTLTVAGSVPGFSLQVTYHLTVG